MPGVQFLIVTRLYSFVQAPPPVCLATSHSPLATRHSPLLLKNLHRRPSTTPAQLCRPSRHIPRHSKNAFSSRRILAEGRRPLGFVLTSTYSPADSQPLPDHALLCVRHSGTCSIGALKMAEGVFFFQLPSNERAQLAQQPDLIERVPVLLAQN